MARRRQAIVGMPEKVSGIQRKDQGFYALRGFQEGHLGLNNLAEHYRTQGKHAAAEPLYKRALAINEKALDPDHPDLATTLDNLAELYRAQGKYAAAEPLHKRSLAIREKALGPEHPEVAQSLENYSALLHKTGRGDKAATLEARAKAIRTKHARENARRKGFLDRLFGR